MARRILVLSMVALLTSYAVADILVQPGYGQPQQHQITTKPSEPMRQANKEQIQQKQQQQQQQLQNLQQQQQQQQQLQQLQQQQQQQQLQQQQQQLQLQQEQQDEPISADAGYHLEFHPVYTNSYDIPADALYPVLQHYRVLPQLYGDLGTPEMLAPGVSDYVPLTVHNRKRRSIKSNADESMEKRDKHDAVAKKSSLDENVSPAVDLQSPDGEATKGLEEKNVKARHHGRKYVPTTSLLGLNPANMYPTQYGTMNMGLDSNQGYVNQPVSYVTNDGASMVEQAATQYPGNLQYAMMSQQGVPQQPLQLGVMRDSEKRNFPDPRTDTSSTSEADASNNGQSEPRTATHGLYNTKSFSISSNKLIHPFGGVHKVNVVKGYQHNTMLGTLRQASDENQASTYPTSVTESNNGEQPSNLVEQNAGQTVQVYQLPYDQTMAYSPVAQYTLLPQTYATNYVGNYGYGYPYSTSSSPTSLRIYLQNPSNAPFVTYQLL